MSRFVDRLKSIELPLTIEDEFVILDEDSNQTLIKDLISGFIKEDSEEVAYLWLKEAGCKNIDMLKVLRKSLKNHDVSQIIKAITGKALVYQLDSFTMVGLGISNGMVLSQRMHACLRLMYGVPREVVRVSLIKLTDL